MRKLQKSVRQLILGLLIAFMLCVFQIAQLAFAQAQVKDSNAMTGKQFENWVVAQTKANKENTTLNTVEQALLKRLRAKEAVTDKTVFMTVFRWVKHEEAKNSVIAADGKKPKASFTDTKRILGALLPLVQNRKDLRLRLIEWKFRLLRLENDYKGSTAAYFKGLEYLGISQAKIGIELWSTGSTLNLANLIRYTLNDKEEAERLYMEVMIYPFSDPPDQTERAAYKKTYINAGKGLIGLRRGDLKKLQDTYFLHIGKDELAPLLSEAIKEAGGNPANVLKTNFYAEGLEDLLVLGDEFPQTDAK